MFRVICVITGYVCGLFNTSLVLGKLCGFDVRKQGSGNAGTTNTLRVMGWKYGFAVLAGDMLKALLPMLILSLLLGGGEPEQAGLVRAYAGLGAVIGHNYPFYSGFKGGKGIATTCGFAAGFHPFLIPVFLIGFLTPFLIWHIVSLSSLTMSVVLFLCVVGMGQAGVFPINVPALYEVYVIVGLLVVMAFVRHRTNIEKLVKGQERKTYIFKKNKVD